ncbi:hypothetical protein [Pelagibacterium montanilacus]|uniref:hypothetical protein n=1 Tax=Pelagibacterium montanilacus TaxID=2185280 RepID=UPI000F8CBA42|nr:hypothetical protein [Pelagibacterium montanilacus]
MMVGISRLVGAAVLALSLSGCVTAGSMFGGGDDARYAEVSASQTQIDAASSTAMPAIATTCPPIRIREGAGTYRVHAGNRTASAQALRHQAVIDRISRNCVVSNGLITVQMGAVGRVILGPSGTEGAMTVPLRFAVERDGVAVYSQRFDVPVTASMSSANEFVHTIENVSIPYVGGESITIWVGFDA